MTGSTGAVLNRILSRVGLERSQLYITNIIRCLPAKGHAITITELDNCRPYLDAELALIQPEVVIALGNYAAQPFFPRGVTKSNDSRIGIIHGCPRTLFTEWGQMIVLPTYHPSNVYREPAIEGVIVTDLSIVRGLLKEEDDDE